LTCIKPPRAAKARREVLRSRAWRLIQINPFDLRIDDAPSKQRSKTMSLESTIVLAAIAFAFAVFSALLAWGDAQSWTLGDR
jgi:hypothetical protein